MDIVLALAAFLVVLVVVVVLMGGLSAITGLLLLTFVFVLIPVFLFVPRLRADRFGKVTKVLNGLAGLAEWDVRGLVLECRVRAPDGSVPPLRMAIASDDGSLRLEIPWEVPADVIAGPAFSYSDLPGVLAEVQSVRAGLLQGESLQTDLAHGVLGSLLRPRWHGTSGSGESAEAVRDRVLDRWRHMVSISRSAATERVFAPKVLIVPEAAAWEYPFFASWCPRCWASRPQWTRGEKGCRKCHTPLWPFWSSLIGSEAVHRKMDQVRSRYAI